MAVSRLSVPVDRRHLAQVVAILRTGDEGGAHVAVDYLLQAVPALRSIEHVCVLGLALNEVVPLSSSSEYAMRIRILTRVFGLAVDYRGWPIKAYRKYTLRPKMMPTHTCAGRTVFRALGWSVDWVPKDGRREQWAASKEWKIPGRTE